MVNIKDGFSAWTGKFIFIKVIIFLLINTPIRNAALRKSA